MTETKVKQIFLLLSSLVLTLIFHGFATAADLVVYKKRYYKEAFIAQLSGRSCSDMELTISELDSLIILNQGPIHCFPNNNIQQYMYDENYDISVYGIYFPSSGFSINLRPNPDADYVKHLEKNFRNMGPAGFTLAYGSDFYAGYFQLSDPFECPVETPTKCIKIKKNILRWFGDERYKYSDIIDEETYIIVSTDPEMISSETKIEFTVGNETLYTKNARLRPLSNFIYTFKWAERLEVWHEFLKIQEK